jgi:hypothetical protein
MIGLLIAWQVIDPIFTLHCEPSTPAMDTDHNAKRER